MEISLFNGFEDRAGEVLNMVPGLNAGHIGIGVMSAGIALLAAYGERRLWPVARDWWIARRFARSEAIRKAKRTKEAMDNRELRLREIIGDIITDGLLRYGADGQLSIQEEKRIAAECAAKLGIPDLVNQKHRVEEIKRGIWARFHQGYYKRTAKDIEFILERRRAARTPPPVPAKETEVVKTAPSKYWKPKPVAA